MAWTIVYQKNLRNREGKSSIEQDDGKELNLLQKPQIFNLTLEHIPKTDQLFDRPPKIRIIPKKKISLNRIELEFVEKSQNPIHKQTNHKKPA